MTVCMDWGRLPLPARIYRASVSVRAPFVAAGLVQLGILGVTGALVACAGVAVIGVVLFARVQGAREGRLTTDTSVVTLAPARQAG